MGSSGRYGKYGETKRFARLRKSDTGHTRANGGGPKTFKHFAQRSKKPFFRDQVKIIPARVTDADFIRKLSKHVFSRYGPYDDTLTGWFLSGTTTTFLILMGKRPLAFAMLGRCNQDRDFSRIYELLAIAVEPEMQGLGVGSLLMRKIEEAARKLEAEELLLHTAVDNMPGRKLFEKHGFSASEIKKRFYPNGQDSLMMKKEFS